MNRNLIGTFSLVALSLFNAAGSYAAPAAAKADVPFAFQVGAAQLPAGCYTVTVGIQNTVEIRSCDGSDAALSPARRDSYKQSSAKLVFQRVGSEYFLTEIDGSSALILPENKARKEALLASNHSDTEKILIALK